MHDLKFMYLGLPRNWYHASKNDFIISEERFEVLVNKLKNLPEKPITLYIQNGCSLFVKEIFNDYSFFGIDFKQYFDDVFNKDSENYDYPPADIVVIYNIGYEKALNVDFSSQILRGLIEELKQNGSHVFLCSYLSPSEFSKKYKYELINKISIKEKPDEQFI